MKFTRWLLGAVAMVCLAAPLFAQIDVFEVQNNGSSAKVWGGGKVPLNFVNGGCSTNAVTGAMDCTFGGDVADVSATTATNPSSEAQLKQLSLPAAALNVANRHVKVFATGRYTTASAQTPTLRFRVYLCTVSGCGSGTVLTLADFTTAATTASITNSWSIEGDLGTISTGASGTLEAKFWQQVQLGTAADLTPETRLTQTNAASSAIDLTAALFLRITVLMSSSNASNTVTARMAYASLGYTGTGWSGSVSGGLTGPGSSTSGNLASFNGTGGGVLQDAGVASANVVTQTSNAASGQVCTYTGTNKICVPATALPNGVTATTQTAADNSTKVATTAYVDSGLSGKQASDAELSVLAGLTLADNGTIVATGAGSATVATLPSCSNTTTSKLLYNSTTHVFSCGTDQSSGSGATSTGSSGAVQTADGAGGLLDSGCTASSGTQTCSGGFIGGSGGGVANGIDIGADTAGTLTFEGATADSFETRIDVVDPTADRTIHFPDESGTVAMTIDNVATATALAANGANCSAGSYPLGVNASGAVESCTNYGSETTTFTNKTLDAEGTGNTITIPAKVWLPGAGCNNATASPFWDLPASTPAVAACVTGSNIQKGVLQYADTSGGFSAQNTIILPADFSGAIDARIIWRTSATSGNAKFSLSTICTDVAASATDDPSFNTASTVTTAAPGTTLRVQTSAITGVTATGCSAGNLLHVKLFRDGNDGSDTLGASLDVIGVELTLRRAM
jgi:hypothetical protein